jgi:hypothetical protein
MTKKKKPVFFNNTDPKKHQPWKRKYKPKFGSKVRLIIDSRIHSIPKFKRKLTQKEKMKKKYNPQNRPQGKDFFIPTIPVKRHPQLHKIETYFVTIFLFNILRAIAMKTSSLQLR